jgi:hypothetical protein
VIATLPYSEKIVYQPIDINLWSPQWLLKRLRWITRPHKFLWKIQDAQRNALVDLIKKRQLKSDYVLFGDLDEIPDLQFIKSLRAGQVSLIAPKTLRQRLFYYHPDIATDNEEWFGTICTPYSKFMQIKPHHLRSQRENLEFIENGGYHLSYFMRPEEIKVKINAIANVERIQSSKELTISEIHQLILENKDLFGRDLGFIRNSDLLAEDLRTVLENYMPWTR